MTSDTSHGVLHFAPHSHDTDELLWARGARIDLHVTGRRLGLHPGHAGWVPAGTVHETTVLGEGELVCLQTAVRLRPAGPEWAGTRVVSGSPLLGELLLRLREPGRPAPERALCRELLTQLLDGAEDRTDVLAVPRDARAAVAARGLLADPADGRSLEEWAAAVGVSPRTLARIFRDETGLSFGRWRSRVRIDAALALLGAGRSVDAVAGAVGYRTTSAFIETFREALGSTPAVYRRRFLRAPDDDRVRR